MAYDNIAPCAPIRNVAGVTFDYARPILNIRYLSWGDETRIRYRLSAITDWQTDIEYVTGSPSVQARITGGLIEGMRYEFEFRSLYTCPADTMAALPEGTYQTLPAYYAFMIPSGEPPPEDFEIVEHTNTTTTLDWTGISGPAVGPYMVAVVEECYPPQCNESVQTIHTEYYETTGPGLTVQNLKPEANYKFYLFRIFRDELIPAVDNYLERCAGEGCEAHITALTRRATETPHAVPQSL